MPPKIDPKDPKKNTSAGTTDTDHTLRSRTYPSGIPTSARGRGARRLTSNKSTMFNTPPLNTQVLKDKPTAPTVDKTGTTQSQNPLSREKEAELINRRMNQHDGLVTSLEDLRGAAGKTHPIFQNISGSNPHTNPDPDRSELLSEIARLRQKVNELSVQSRPMSTSTSFAFPTEENEHRTLRSQETESAPKKKKQERKGAHPLITNHPKGAHRHEKKRLPTPQPSEEDTSSDSSQSEEEESSNSRHSHRRRDPPRNFRCEMDRWPIRFDGTNVQKFLKKLNRLQRSYDYSDEIVAKYFHLLIEGKAVNWFWVYCEEHEDIDLKHMKKEMARVFKTYESDISLTTRMYERKQGKDSFENFYYDILDINYTMKNPLSDPQIIEILRSNMDDEVRQRIFTYETRDRTKYFHKANKAYKDVCKTRERRKETFANPRTPRRIHEVDLEDLSSTEIEEISAKINNWKAKRNQLTCFNCHSAEHLLRDCPEEITRFFCFKCGLDGYATPKCPKCSLNSTRSAENVRISRSQ